MTLKVIQLNYCELFKCDFFGHLCNIWQDLNWHSAFHGLCSSWTSYAFTTRQCRWTHNVFRLPLYLILPFVTSIRSFIRSFIQSRVVTMISQWTVGIIVIKLTGNTCLPLLMTWLDSRSQRSRSHLGWSIWWQRYPCGPSSSFLY